MEDIEQLKLENDKLKERLNNAAKFFREQKAQIESLTKENEELKGKPKDDYVSPEKWNVLVTEKEELKAQLNASNAACADMEKAIHKNLEDIEKLKKENDKLKSDYTILNNEYLNNENILNETLAANKELVESNNKLTKTNNELDLKINACQDEVKIEKKLSENLSETLNALKGTHAELKNTYEELKKQVITYKKQLTETEEALNNAENVIATINTAVNHHTETAAKKVIKENKQHRIGDEHIMGENIGI